jgi:hypothetical protein
LKILCYESIEKFSIKSPPKQILQAGDDEKIPLIVHEKGTKWNALIHNLGKTKTLNSLSDTAKNVFPKDS